MKWLEGQEGRGGGGGVLKLHDLKVFWARRVVFGLIHLEHGVKDHSGACKTNARLADCDPDIGLHGIRRAHATIRRILEERNER